MIVDLTDQEWRDIVCILAHTATAIVYSTGGLLADRIKAQATGETGVPREWST